MIFVYAHWRMQYVCGEEGRGLELHPATSSWQDYWHRIPLLQAEIAGTQGQSTRIWERPRTLLLCKCVLSVCFVLCLCLRTNTHVAVFLSGTELPGSRRMEQHACSFGLPLLSRHTQSSFHHFMWCFIYIKQPSWVFTRLMFRGLTFWPPKEMNTHNVSLYTDLCLHYMSNTGSESLDEALSCT